MLALADIYFQCIIDDNTYRLGEEGYLPLEQESIAFSIFKFYWKIYLHKVNIPHLHPSPPPPHPPTPPQKKKKKKKKKKKNYQNI